MATPEEILRRHADRPIVRTYIRRPAHTTSTADREARWRRSMGLLDRARDLRPRATTAQAGTRPPLAATMKRLHEVRSRLGRRG